MYWKQFIKNPLNINTVGIQRGHSRQLICYTKKKNKDWYDR